MRASGWLRAATCSSCAGNSARSGAPGKSSAIAASGLKRDWDFGDVPTEREVERGGLQFTVYPALKDSGDGVELVELDAPLMAEHETRKGVQRLLLLALAQQLRFARKRFADRNELALLASVTLPDIRIADRLAERVILDAFLPEEQATPRTRAQFEAVIAGGRDRFAVALERLEARALEMLGELKTVRQKLRALGAPACKAAVADIEQQLAGLFPTDFLERTPQSRLTQYPRYLKALARRLDRLPAGVTRDAELMRTVEPFIREWQGLRLAAGGPAEGGAVA